MAGCKISASYPPDIDPTQTPLAYGDRAVPRLNQELQDEILIVRQRAVMSLCDYLHDPEHIAEALQHGIQESLKTLLRDPDLTVRQKSTECLYIIAGHAIGREAFLKHNIVIPVSELFNDEEAIARKNAHMTIEMVAKTPPGAEGIAAASLIRTLVEKLITEVDEIKDIILDTLHFCMHVDAQKALDAGGMKVFTELLKHDSPVIRGKAARDIMDLSIPPAGKDKAVEEGTVEALVGLLKDDDTAVRAGAAGGLMSITITTKGKSTAIKAEAIPALVALVNDPTSEVRLNSLKALTCLAEAPDGRETLMNNIDKITGLQQDASKSVARAAEIAVNVITWKP